MREQFDSQLNNNEEFDEAYALMMDALDGTLSARQERELRQYLQTYPELAEEWNALQVVDSWLMDAPQAQPTENFVEHTILRLPNLYLRRWAVAVSFAVVLLLGMLPMLGLAVAFTAFSNADLVASLQFLAQMGGVVADAMVQWLIGWGEFTTQNPAMIGMMLLMVGAVTLWSGVYNQMVNREVVVVRAR